VPKGTSVCLSLYLLNRNPQIYPKPEIFNPDRFFTQESAKRHPYDFLPFSGGARNCIGKTFALKQIKIVMAHLVRHFRFEANAKEEDLDLTLQISLRASNGVHIRLIPRN